MEQCLNASKMMLDVGSQHRRDYLRSYHRVGSSFRDQLINDIDRLCNANRNGSLQRRNGHGISERASCNDREDE